MGSINSDIAVIGNFSIDSIIFPKQVLPFVALGGSVAYVSLVARRLNTVVSVISKVGVDFSDAHLWWLRKEGVDLSGIVRVENGLTTRFELKYCHDLTNRVLRLVNKAPSIEVGDLPKSLNVNVVHVAPIAGEIGCRVVKKLRSHAKILCVDVQGFVRLFNNAGIVSYGSLVNRRILELVNIFKSSLDEIQVVTGVSNVTSAMKVIHDYGVEIVIVTLGGRGALLSFEDTIYEIPAWKCDKIADTTGAGDVFIGGFLAEYLRDGNPFWSACVGSAAASLAVEVVGPVFRGGSAEIYRRAHTLYEKKEICAFQLNNRL